VASGVGAADAKMLELAAGADDYGASFADLGAADPKRLALISFRMLQIALAGSPVTLAR
jgi:hypothetical protein